MFFGIDLAKELLEKLARKICTYYKLGEHICILQGAGGECLFSFRLSF